MYNRAMMFFHAIFGSPSPAFIHCVYDHIPPHFTSQPWAKSMTSPSSASDNILHDTESFTSYSVSLNTVILKYSEAEKV